VAGITAARFRGILAATMKDTIRWGILGCGDVTEVKSGPALAHAEGSALVAVMRRTPHLAEDYARRHGVPRWYSSARELIEDPDVDAVYVATPPGAHLDLALAVAAAGKPAYVEKPMARNHAECRRMATAFAGAGLPLFVAYYRRALPRFEKVRALLAEGRIGRPASLAYRYAHTRRRSPGDGPGDWRLDPAQAGGGLVLDLGCHALDLFDWLLGPLGDVAGSATRASPEAGSVEDVVTMSFRAESGVLGAAAWDFAGVGPYEDRVEIGGTAGTLRFAVFGNDPIRLVTATGAEESFAAPNPKHIQEPLIRTVVDALRGKGSCPSTGETAARTSQVMDTVLAGFYGGRDDVFWERR
jgi:1,5-anhydro-D-fructose reductase (1,5-anhydro-D-mannitol-forming)